MKNETSKLSFSFKILQTFALKGSNDEVLKKGSNDEE